MANKTNNFWKLYELQMNLYLVEVLLDGCPYVGAMLKTATAVYKVVAMNYKENKLTVKKSRKRVPGTVRYMYGI